MPRQPARKFLAPGGRSGNGHGFYTQPQRPLPHGADTPELALEAGRVADRTHLCDEPEFPGSAIVDAYGELARTYDMVRRAREREERQEARALLTAEQRLKDAQHRAKRQHVNLTGEFHKVRSMLDRAKRGGHKEPQSALHHLEKIESTLDGPADIAA